MAVFGLARSVSAATALALLTSACSTWPLSAPWQQRLRGDTVALLGEVHDNAEHHRLRLEALQRAVAAGWRPAIAMEQFDRDRQADIDRARREQPGDAQYLIDAATARAARGAWDWQFYRPVVELALRYELPLIAANLSNADTTKIVRGGYASVFDDAGLERLGLHEPVATDLQAAQEQAIDAGHCRALPPTLWPRMARAQFARDAIMASVLRQQADRGVVLLAGNGHVRRDKGVPRWLGDPWRDRLLVVGFVERGDVDRTASAYDAVVEAAPADRSDPCEEFLKRRPPAG